MDCASVSSTEVSVVLVDPVLAGWIEDVEIEGVFEGCSLVRGVRRNGKDLAGADNDLRAVYDKAQRARKNVRNLFVGVAMERDVRALFEEDAGEHGSRGGDVLAVDEGVHGLGRNFIPSVVSGHGVLLNKVQAVMSEPSCSPLMTRTMFPGTFIEKMMVGSLLSLSSETAV